MWRHKASRFPSLWGVGILVGLLAVAVAAPAGDPAAPDPGGVDPSPLLAEISSITGLPQKRPVRVEYLDREGLRLYLERKLKATLKDDEILSEETLLKMLGLIPADYDLRASVLELLTEQAEAFYDFEARRLYLVDPETKPDLAPVLVHELAHALADQHFRLKKFHAGAGRSDDAALARMAVIEGQATWVASEFALRRAGLSLASSAEGAELMARAMASKDSEFPVLARSPRYVRETLLFPYLWGFRFQDALFRKYGRQAFRLAFLKPPVGTAQVMDPQLYFQPATADSPPLPSLRRGTKRSRWSEGVLGRLDFEILLSEYAPGEDAAAMASQLQSGRYRLDRRTGTGSTGGAILAVSSLWKDSAAASRIFQSTKRWLQEKRKPFAFVYDKGGWVVGHSPEGCAVARCEGRLVWVLLGLREAQESEAWSKFAGIH